MANEITFKVPTKDGVEERTGKVAIIKIGDKPYKFVLQRGGIGNKSVVCLTHYASGRVFGWFNDIRLRLQAGLHQAGNRKRLSPRQLADMMVADKVARYGADKIMHSIDNAEVVNG